MIETVKSYLGESARPLMTWATEKGADIAFNVVMALLILLVGIWVIRLASKFLRKALEGRVKSNQMLVSFVVSVMVKAAWALLAVMVLDRLGVEVGPLVAGLGITGFILGFAFQESLGSLAAGMMIAVNQPFKVGDFVSVAGFDGTIVHLDMMAVTLKTGDNRRITIPNKQAWGQPIVNFSALELRRVDIPVGIAYGTDIAKAREAAIGAFRSLGDIVLADPPPMAEAVSLGDSAVVLTCRAWVKNADYWPVFFAATKAVKEAFDAQGIAIPFPQMEISLKNGENILSEIQKSRT